MIKEWLLIVDFALIQLSIDIQVSSWMNFQLISIINKQLYHTFHI